MRKLLFVIRTPERRLLLIRQPRQGRIVRRCLLGFKLRDADIGTAQEPLQPRRIERALQGDVAAHARAIDRLQGEVDEADGDGGADAALEQGAASPRGAAGRTATGCYDPAAGIPSARGTESAHGRRPQACGTSGRQS